MPPDLLIEHRPVPLVDPGGMTVDDDIRGLVKQRRRIVDEPGGVKGPVGAERDLPAIQLFQGGLLLHRPGSLKASRSLSYGFTRRE